MRRAFDVLIRSKKELFGWSSQRSGMSVKGSNVIVYHILRVRDAALYHEPARALGEVHEGGDARDSHGDRCDEGQNAPAICR